MRGRFITMLAIAGALATPALAQAEPTATRQSLWSVIRAGIEWPAWFILAGSVVALALIIEHFITIRRATITPPQQVAQTRKLIERRQFRECLEFLRPSSTFFALSMTAALNHARHGFEAMHEAATEKTGELSGHMFRKVEYMNILGNLGPLFGLLGTVYGMIIAFAELGHGGESGADAGFLARGISLALVNTLLGLLLAVVGLGFFGVCRNRVDSLTASARQQILDLLEYFRPAPAPSAAISGVGAPTTPRPAAAPPAARSPAATQPSALSRGIGGTASPAPGE